MLPNLHHKICFERPVIQLFSLLSLFVVVSMFPWVSLKGLVYSCSSLNTSDQLYTVIQIKLSVLKNCDTNYSLSSNKFIILCRFRITLSIYFFVANYYLSFETKPLDCVQFWSVPEDCINSNYYCSSLPFTVLYICLARRPFPI